MIDQAYRVPVPALGLTARLIVSEREHPREAQPDLGDLFVHVKVPASGISEEDLLSRLDSCLDIFERKKKLGLLYERPSRIKISRLGVYLRDENGDPFTLDVMIALFAALVDHLDRTQDPGDGENDTSGNVDDSEDRSEFSEEENGTMYKDEDRSGSGKLPKRDAPGPAVKTSEATGDGTPGDGTEASAAGKAGT